MHAEGDVERSLTTRWSNTILHQNVADSPHFRHEILLIHPKKTLPLEVTSNTLSVLCGPRPRRPRRLRIYKMYKIYPLKLVKVMKNHISQLVGLIGLDGPSIGSILSSILNVIRVINNALRFAKNTSPL